MKNFINEIINRIPRISLTFTIGVLYAAIINLINGNEAEGFCRFVVGYAGCCIGIYLITYLVEFIPFKSNVLYHTINALLCYSFFMGCSYLFKFFDFDMYQVLSATLVFFIMYIALSAYIISDYRRKSKEINDLLSKK